MFTLVDPNGRGAPQGMTKPFELFALSSSNLALVLKVVAVPHRTEVGSGLVQIALGGDVGVIIQLPTDVDALAKNQARGVGVHRQWREWRLEATAGTPAKYTKWRAAGRPFALLGSIDVSATWLLTAISLGILVAGMMTTD